MIFNTVKAILILTILFLNSVGSQASDFSTIYDRMYAAYLGNPSAGNVETVLKKIKVDGSFEDINYKTTEGTPRSHPIMLATLASAYKNPESKYYHDATVKAKYLIGLKFWVDTNHHAANWWFRYIAYPKEVTKSVVLMRDEIKADKDLFSKTVRYLRWSYENSDASRLTGANGADVIMGSMAASVMTENHEQMIDFRNQMDRLLTIQDRGEGVEPDYMFSQHSQGGKGRQLYYGNYGKEYINSVLYYFEFCNNTQYNSAGISLLEDIYINAIQWIFYSKNYDPNQAGRFDSSNQYYGQYESMTKRFLNLNTPRKVEIKKVYDRITGENSLSGNRMFWRFDYMINRRPNFMVSTRMSSTRTVGSEAGLGNGEFNFYSGSGTNYIFNNGSEYSGDYFKKFNYRQFPGITAEQDNAKLPIPNWGAFASNGNSYAGGVSDSMYGACGMVLQRRGVVAHKSWFYFDDEFVCLGAGINQTDGKSPVYTTLNQCNINGEVQYAVGGKATVLNGTKAIKNPDWILHGTIGYINLEPTSSFVLTCDSNLFSANVNHDTNPKDGCYAYVVRPSLKSVKAVKKYTKNIQVSILSNTEKIQAVKHQKLNVTEVLFFEAGILKLSKEKSIEVDAPCALLWKESTGEITLANPYCETMNPPLLNLKIKNKETQIEMVFKMPTGVKSGSSVTQKIEKQAQNNE